MAGGCHGISAGRLGIAFACVIGAGLASIVGGLFVILMRVKNTFFLAASLAFAAGVMLYISFVDVYAGKAVGHFVEAGYSDAHAFTFATICFFCGYPISWILDKIAEHLAYHGHEAPKQSSSICASPTMAQNSTTPSVCVNVVPSDLKSGLECDYSQPSTTVQVVEEQKAVKDPQSLKLVHLGILAAMAVALHNMPEGLVTFVGYMDNATSGITTAVAIAIHNIPEGMVISSAVYFGTGNRWRALCWATLAALAEPLGGLIGLGVVCGGSMTNTVFGIMFGLVGGIMTYISLKELLPAARNFDPEDRVCTIFLTSGMIIMACSLVAIAFSSPEAEAVEALAIAMSVPYMPSASLTPPTP